MDKRSVFYITLLCIGFTPNRLIYAKDCPEGWIPIESTLPHPRKAPGIVSLTMKQKIF